MKNAEILDHRTTTKTVLDLMNLYRGHNLNLNPGFQRQSVWRERDRAKLIESILRNYPLPAVFLYKRHDGGHVIYDVIDGKQRLESILMFTGEMRGRFATNVLMPGADAPESVDWRWLNRKGQQHRITNYSLPVIEVDGELGDIIDVFVRWRCNGVRSVRLTNQQGNQRNCESARRGCGMLYRRWMGEGDPRQVPARPL